MKNKRRYFDMHTHSENSHDCAEKAENIAKAAADNCAVGIAVTDHCDIEFFDTVDLRKICENSIKDAITCDMQSDVTVLHGIEMGEAHWHTDVAQALLNEFDFDAVIGSVHAVRYSGYDMPYSQIDFSEMGKVETEKYFDKYLDDVICMLEKCDIDILAHLTCPLRYINGKFGLGIDCKRYERKITEILKYIVRNNIALELNTSCMCGGRYSKLMPEEWVVELYKSLGGYLITTGSDAHIAENTALSFDCLYKFIAELGFESVYYYKNRRAIPFEI